MYYTQWVLDGFHFKTDSILVAVFQKIWFLYCFSFYRAMHFSAKRGIAIACRLSVRLSGCNVGGL